MMEHQVASSHEGNDVERLFQEATSHLEQQRPHEAAAACEELLKQEPRHAPTLHLIGAMALRSGKLELALESLQKAVTAEASPTYVADLADAHIASGQVSEAVALLARALEKAPQSAELWLELGRAERARGELQRARAALETAARLSPRVPEVHAELGATLVSLGVYSKAAEHLEAVTILNPESAEAHFAAAHALDRVGDPKGAIAHYECCVELNPRDSRALNNLGNALSSCGRLDESAACFERAIEVDPSLAAPYSNWGTALRSLSRLDDAVRAFRRAHELNPRDPTIHSNLLFTLEFHPDCDDAMILAEARRWNELHVAPLIPASRHHRRRSEKGRRLRVGYVSANFHGHVQALFMLPLFEHHDRAAFEIFAYSNVRTPDVHTQSHLEGVEHFRDISRLDDESAARLIEEDQIDVLVDLTLHMAGSRLHLFARCPAPVQISWLAYPGTTGVAAIDYRFTDPYIDPPELPRHASEKTYRLPDTFWCFHPGDESQASVEPGPLPALANGYVTFGCLNNPSKVNDDVLSLWALVLAAVPSSRLLMLAPPGSSRERVVSFLEKSGVGADRIEFVPYQRRADYLRTFQRIDISLDTVPATGHTTSLDSWWMGVPVLNLIGRTIAGRAGLTYAANLDLTEWCVNDVQSYVDAAQRISSDISALTELRAGLRQRIERSPLMDARRFARNLEAAYQKMWRDWYAAQGAS